MERYILERDGQIDFFQSILPRVNPGLTQEDIIQDNNDGVLNGNLLEFKLNIQNLNIVLFQAIKYLSALRIKGKPVPAGIHLISLNTGIDYYFRSETYLSDIEKVYIGGASKDNQGFIGGNAVEVLRYRENAIDAERMIALFKEKRYVKIHIDENCIVGWAKAYYAQCPHARKEDFLGDDKGQHRTLGEIRNPRVFKECIYPYTGDSNIRFNYLMDKLNDTMLKKNLGAFYTPSAYAKKSLELVRQAIAKVPSGNDYIILDRCAGTGNLEEHMTDEELSHCIVSTLEYYEYKVLQELLGAKVRHIIPPMEMGDTFNAGLVAGADALSREYIENPIIRQYLDNPRCTMILFENPPYSEPQAVAGQKTAPWKNSYVVSEMKKEVKGTVSNDLGNVFIWSAFKYYLRQPTDSYIVYSPVKYWKAQHLVNKKFGGGYAFNRKYFHTNIDACIMCAYWLNENDDIDFISLSAFNIDNNNQIYYENDLPVKKVCFTFSDCFYEKSVFNDAVNDGIAIAFDGTEVLSGQKKITILPQYSKSILGYMRVGGFNFDNPDLESSLLIAGCYNAHGFYICRDNYLEKLPMFAASRYITYNRAWTERGRIMKSADGAEKFYADVANRKLTQFLLKCLLFTCMEMQNHMRTFTGSDGRFYRNELCLDGTNGETLAMRDLQILNCNAKEREILRQWNTVLQCAKATAEYNLTLTYGVYQIFSELNLSDTNEQGEKVYRYIALNTALTGLKTLVKEYYQKEIVPILFEYEFLK